jgi:PilZ domain-containing protein
LTDLAASTEPDRPTSHILFGRFMLPDTSEHACKVSGLSVEGAIFSSELSPPAGLPIVAYIETIGRIVGVSGDPTEGGFKVNFTLAGNRRERLASRLASLNTKGEEEESEPRRAQRFQLSDSSSQLCLPDGRVYACEVLDISLTGASVKTDILPTLGTCIVLGKMRGRIVRYTDQGIAIEFVNRLDQATLARQIMR